MSTSPTSMLERQVRKVRRRMFIQASVNAMIAAWVAACAVFAIWLLAKPYIRGGDAYQWLDWIVGGIALGVCSIGALIWAYRHTPAPIQAALSLDERFHLRERVTTSLTLSDDQRASPAGQALLSDAQNKIESLDVRSRFPVKFGWKSALVPAAVAAVALLAIFYQPVINTAQGNNVGTAPLTPDQAKEIEQKKQEFLQKPKADPKQPNRMKSPDLEKIEAKLQEILKKPMTTQDEVKDRLAEISQLEEEVKKKEKEQAEKIEGFKEQLQKLDQLSKKEKKNNEENGPAKDLRNALEQGDTKKAKEEADRLSKKLKNNELDKKEQDHLEKELKDLKDDLERLKREREKELEDKRKENEEKRKEKEKQLEQQRNEGKLDREQYEQEKKKLEEERKKEEKELKEQKQELDQLQKKMEKCEQCMKNGDKEGASQALRDAAEQLEKQEQQEQQLDDLENELQRMQDLREGMAKACENGQGREGQEDDAETLSRRKDGEGQNGGKGLGKGRTGKGRRPEKKTGDSKSIDAKQNAPFDKKGAKIHVGTAGQAEKVIGKASVSIQGEIKQASQDAPEAVETQRIPRGYKDSTKGYFKNIGDQKTGDNLPMPPK